MNDKLNNDKLNEVLRLIRVFHNISQREASKLLDIPQSHICSIETKKRKPTLETIQKYADAFKVPLSSILFFAENAENAKLGKIKEKLSSKAISILQWIELNTQ